MKGITALDGQLVQLFMSISDRQVVLTGTAQLDDGAEGMRCLHVKVQDAGHEYEFVIQEETWNGVILSPLQPGDPFSIHLDAVASAA